MISAAQARQEAEAIRMARFNKLKKSVEEIVHAAVYDGATSCFIGKLGTPEICDWLYSIGYTVDRNVSNEGMPDVKVKW